MEGEEDGTSTDLDGLNIPFLGKLLPLLEMGRNRTRCVRFHMDIWTIGLKMQIAVH